MLKWSDYGNRFNYGLRTLAGDFKRANSFSKASLFGTKVAPYDIAQGAIGNCYFMAACSAFAEMEKKFKRIFLIDNLNT